MNKTFNVGDRVLVKEDHFSGDSLYHEFTGRVKAFYPEHNYVVVVDMNDEAWGCDGNLTEKIEDND